MKDSLEYAFGVGFIENGQRCIQGKGLTWEAAFTQAESRREKWYPRVQALQKREVETRAKLLDMGVVTKEDLVGDEVDVTKDAVAAAMKRIQDIEDHAFLGEEEQLIRRLKDKVQKKWGEG